MAEQYTLDQLLAEKARRESLKANTQERGIGPDTRKARDIFNGNTQSTPITIDGKPYDQFMQDNATAKPQYSLQELLAEKARREAIKAQGSGPDPRIATDAVPTGMPEIDYAGGTYTPETTGPLAFPHPKTFPKIEDREFDDPIRLRAESAQTGVDYNHGLPAWQRLKLAAGSNIPEMRAMAIKRQLSDNFAKIPDDLPKFRYDPMLEEFQFLRPDEKNPGKYRWTSMDGTGLQLSDMSEFLNPANLLSIAGYTVGAGKRKMFGFLFKSEGKQAFAGGLTGGLSGRYAGEGLNILNQYLMSGGTEYPTWDMLKSYGWDPAKIEAFTAVTGELGAKILRSASNMGQDLAAVAAGKNTVENMDKATVQKANQYIRQTQSDMERMGQKIGRYDYVVTQGQASHSIPLIAEENIGIRNASSKTKQEYLNAQAQSDKALQDYIEAEFGGNARFLGDREGVVHAANTVLVNNDKMVVAQTTDGLIHVAPKNMPEHGLKIDPNMSHDSWMITSSGLPPEAARLGYGSDMLTVATNEAKGYGKGLMSTSELSEGGYGAWRQLEKNGEKIEWNPNIATREGVDGSKVYYATDGMPVAQVKTPEPIVPILMQSSRGARGKMEPAREFRKFLRNPLPGLRNQFRTEIANNPFLKQDVREGIFKDFEDSVIDKETGRMSVKLLDKWKKQVGGILEDVYTPQEVAQIMHTPNGLRNINARYTRQLADTGSILSKQFGLGADVLKNNKKLWGQLRNMPGKKVRRVLHVLDSSGSNMGNEVRALFKEDLKNQLLKKTRGKADKPFDEWLNDNRDLITNVLQDPTYFNALRTIQHAMKRKADAGLVRGLGADANPTGLALTRVIFGPLSRAQRFFSAARRGGVRASGAKVGSLITDPTALKELVQLRQFPVASRAMARFLVQYDLLPTIGWFDTEKFDPDNPEHRQRVADLVMRDLQAELAHTPEYVK